MSSVHDREVEKIEQMGIEAAVELLWERDRAVRMFPPGDRGVLWACHFRLIVQKGVETLGMSVVCDDMGNVEEVIYPVSGYFKDALKEREAVSIPEVGQVKGHGYHDPCDQALINSGRLKDV